MGRFGTGIVFGARSQTRARPSAISSRDSLQAKIVALDGEEGDIELSLSEAGKQSFGRSQKNFPSRASHQGKIVAANAGGLMTTVADDLKAFLPVSQLSLEHYPKVPDGDRIKIAEELKNLSDRN